MFKFKTMKIITDIKSYREIKYLAGYYKKYGTKVIVQGNRKNSEILVKFKIKKVYVKDFVRDLALYVETGTFARVKS